MASASVEGKWKLLRPGRLPDSGKHRYLMDFGTNDYELYDLDADIGEKNNLAAKHPDIVKRLDALLVKHKESHGGKEKQPTTTSGKPQAQAAAPKKQAKA